MTAFDHFESSVTLLIDLEDIETWPEELRQHFERNLELFRSYEVENARLDVLRELDRMAYYRNGGNRYVREWNAAVEEVIPLVEPYDIQSFHCSRLCDDEIAAILANGMELPSPAMLERRIDARVAAGDFPEAVAAKLKGSNYAADKNRAGMLWFVSGKSILQDQGGLYRLFRHWGGEALYGPHEDDNETAPYLHRTGIPCIVEAALPLADYEPFFHYRAMYSRFILTKGMKSNHGTAAEGNIKLAVPVERIRRVIRHDDVEFETLTHSAGWHQKIM